MMNLNFRKMAGLTVASFFLCVTSCRTSDTDNNLANSGPATVKINFKGDTYDEDTDPKASTRSMVAEKTTVMVDPSTYVNIEVAPDNTPKTRAGRAALPLHDAMLRVVVYKGNLYVTHQDYWIEGGKVSEGMGEKPMELDGGTTYTIIAYSSGGYFADLPAFDKTKPLLSATLDYDYNKAQDFMWFKDTFTPKGGEVNNLNILLKHKVAAITLSLNIKGKQIQEITKVSITPNKRFATVRFRDGEVTEPDNVTVPTVNNLNYAGLNSGTVSTLSGQVLVNYQSQNGNKDGVFSADVKIDNDTRPITTDPFFSINRGRKRNLKIDFNMTSGKCGAVIMDGGKIQFREFACFNLGAAGVGDPSMVDRQNIGTKYRFGEVDPASTLKQETSTKPQAGETGRSEPKTEWVNEDNRNDPCVKELGPDYKVPSIQILNSIVTYNDVDPKRDQGTWTLDDTGRINSQTFITPKKEYKNLAPDGAMLTLPAGGSRPSQYNGALWYRNYLGAYWSTSGYAASPPNYPAGANYIEIIGNYGGSGFKNRTLDRASALSVRCMKIK
ncbi:hypothetical protein VO54_03668 [Elizabethkingia miricola]|nr:hypothetical protein VO54_03668 [Elizabethkingia miricola]